MFKGDEMTNKKMVAWLICVVLLTTLLTSCENVMELSVAEVSEANAEEELVSELPETQEYVGTDFVIAITQEKLPLFSSEEDSESIVKAAVYERNKLVVDKYGVALTYKSVSSESIVEEMKRSQEAGMQYADLLCFSGETTVSLADRGYLYNILSSSDFNIDASYIETENTKNITTNNSLFMLYDSATQYYEDTWAVFYDKKLIEDNGLTDPSILTANDSWTWEKFKEYSELVAANVLNKGSPDLAVDVFGFGAYDNEYALPLALWESSGTPMFGDTYLKEVKITDNLVGLNEVANALELVYTSKSRFPLDEFNSQKAFFEGRLAFYIGTLKFSSVLDNAMEEYEEGLGKYTREWGLLPLPKLSEAQENYCSFVDSEAAAISIPANVANPQKSITLLNAFCAASGDAIKEAVYNKYVNLFFRNNSSTVLLETMMNTAHFDMAALYGSGMDKVADISIDLIVSAIAENGVIDRPISEKTSGFTKFSEEKFK